MIYIKFYKQTQRRRKRGYFLLKHILIISFQYIEKFYFPVSRNPLNPQKRKKLRK